MSEPELTDAVIRQALRRAVKAVCPLADQRCYGFLYDAQTALASGTPAGWCCVGWVAADSGRKTWTAWFSVHTGEGRLRRWRDDRRIKSRRSRPHTRNGFLPNRKDL